MSNIKPRRPEMGKWLLWRFFASRPAIRPYLPATTIMTKSTLGSYLHKYKTVYVKPAAGQQGKGIIRAWESGDRYLFVKERGKAFSTSSLDILYRKIKPSGITSVYIVQQAIHLAEVKNRPFDIRLMMMRNASGKWEYAGMLAKVAGPDSVITNLRRGGGYVTEVETALKCSLGLSQDKIDRLKREMITLGHATCARFDDYKRYWQIGLDLAVDKNGRLWMIEENTGPAHSLFAKLKNKSMYRKIREFTALRRKNKKC